MASGESHNVHNTMNINFFISGGGTDAMRQIQMGLELAGQVAVQGLAGSNSRRADSRVFQQTSRMGQRVEGPARQRREVCHDQPRVPVDHLKLSVVHIRERGGTGTGFIVDAARKLVLTNKHVYGGGQNLAVEVFDGNGRSKSYPAALVGGDDAWDLALLELVHCNDKKLTAVRFGSSESLRVMQRVFTIGDPLNVGSTVTSGQISAFPDDPIVGEKSVIHGAIQLDAHINGGNSGGPLFNMDGEVIGVVYAGHSEESSGISYAIPANTAEQWMKDCVKQHDRRKLISTGSSDGELDASSDDENLSVISSRSTQRGPSSSLASDQRTIASLRSASGMRPTLSSVQTAEDFDSMFQDFSLQDQAELTSLSHANSRESYSSSRPKLVRKGRR